MAANKGFTPVGILHFAIGVTDLEEARHFYEDVLGCTYLRQNDTTVFMQAGGQYFVLTNTKHHKRPNPPGEYEFHHAFIVDGDDFDGALRYLEKEGYPILVYEEEGHRTFTGRHAYVQDPFGNSIEIIDFHGVGDFSKPDFQGRQRRKKMKGATKKASAKKSAKKAPRKAANKSPQKTSKKAPRKTAKKAAAKKKAPATAKRRRPGRPTRRPVRPMRRR